MSRLVPAVLDGPPRAVNAAPVPRFFNTSGPCHPTRDYMLPAAARLPEVRGLVARGKYFVIHAPRQTGKTTAVASLAQERTETGAYVAALVSMEVGSAMRDDIGAAELAILGAWRSSAESRLPADLVPPVWPAAPPGQ